MTRRKRRSRSLARRWVRRLVLLTLAVFVGYQVWVFVHVAWWVDHNPTTTAFIQERLKTLRAEHAHVPIRQRWVAYGNISDNLKRAVIAAEDATFVYHDGFAWGGIEQALLRDVRAGHIVAGGSTISQQLAKNLFLSPERTLWRKGEEALITLMLEGMMSKQRILEIYLNVIEWGNGLYGASAAAHYYYHVDCDRLTPDQAARLAAMIPDPRYFQTHPHNQDLIGATTIIRDRMNEVRIP
ncbi:MAG: monofunctional biosynthetic peptidoglycan transglycosylase [Gammaproteobacteria bacterium]